MKKKVMILILTMLTTMWVGVGSVSASDYGVVGEVPTVAANADEPQDLAALSIRVPVLSASAAPNHHRLLISLPSDFRVAQAGGALPAVSEVSGNSGLSWKLYELDGNTPLSVGGEGVREFILEVKNTDVVVDARLVVTLPKVMVGDSGHNIRVTLKALSGDFNEDNDNDVVAANLGETFLQATTIRPVDIGRNNFDKVELEFKETAKGDLTINRESLRLRLPEGFVWQTQATAVDITNSIGGGLLNIDYTDDKRVLLLERTGFVSNPATVRIKGVVELKDVNAAANGNINLRIFGKSKTEQNSLNIGKYEKRNTVATKFTIGSTGIEKTSGKNVVKTFMDVAPYIKNDRTMIPLRYVGEAFGYTVSWDEASRTAVLVNQGDTVNIYIDSDTFSFNGQVHRFDTPPEIMQGRVMLSIANIGKALGLEVGHDIIWEPDTQTVVVNLTR